jgi:hypothetical protein
MNYLKYYFLEDYLFKEVKNNFKKRGYLTTEEFFCIIIWKSNRAKTAIKRKLLKFGNLKTVVKKLTSEIFHTSETEQKLELLIKSWKFNLPIATAILTILYPQEFTIYDMRVRGQIGIRKDFSGRKDQIKRYFDEFLPKVKQLGKGKNLRNKDRYLWGKSFYQNLMKFLKRGN